MAQSSKRERLPLASQKLIMMDSCNVVTANIRVVTTSWVGLFKNPHYAKKKNEVIMIIIIIKNETKLFLMYSIK